MKNEQILDLVDKLSEKLGTSGGMLIETYMPLVIATAWSYMILGLFFMTIFIIIIIFLYFHYKKVSGSGDPIEESPFIAGVLINIFLLILGLTFIFQSIPSLIAPKAATISRILTELKGR